jgi:hypothetical protein
MLRVGADFCSCLLGCINPFLVMSEELSRKGATMIIMPWRRSLVSLIVGILDTYTQESSTLQNAVRSTWENPLSDPNFYRLWKLSCIGSGSRPCTNGLQYGMYRFVVSQASEAASRRWTTTNIVKVTKRSNAEEEIDWTFSGVGLLGHHITQGLRIGHSQDVTRKFLFMYVVYYGVVGRPSDLISLVGIIVRRY